MDCYQQPQAVGLLPPAESCHTGCKVAALLPVDCCTGCMAVAELAVHSHTDHMTVVALAVHSHTDYMAVAAKSAVRCRTDCTAVVGLCFAAEGPVAMGAADAAAVDHHTPTADQTAQMSTYPHHLCTRCASQNGKLLTWP